MKFINYLTSISGIEIFPLTSLLIFFLFFVALFIYVMKFDKKAIEDLSQIPLDENENDKIL